MEFNGRITKVMPTRTGISKQGNPWKALPFIFTYSEDVRSTDRVLLETWDTNTMAEIAKFVEKDENGKAIVENGAIKLVAPINVTIGFSHSVKTLTRQDGTTFDMNDVRIYKFELMEQEQPQGEQAAAEDDDLPF